MDEVGPRPVQELLASPETVHWGYFDPSLPPRLTVQLGEIVRVEAVTHQGNVDARFQDEAIARIYREVTDRGPGPHILTGPIAIEGVRAGDPLAVEVLALEPRLSAAMCGQVPIGLLHQHLGGQVRGTVFSVDADVCHARPLFRFRYPDPRPRPEEALVIQREATAAGLVVPLRPHLGIAAVAPATSGRTSSSAPGNFGGNLDQWRFGPGTRMLYRAQVDGALFSCGDVHLAQGDGEVSGNGLESHATVTLRFSRPPVEPPRNPVLEADDSFVVHGLGSTLDDACRDAALEALELLTRCGLDRIDAYTLLSLAVDFGVTQAVNGTVGIHGIIGRATLEAARG